MKFEKSRKYDMNFLKENMMGPNCIKLLEDLTKDIQIEKGMRVLDLGCGKGLTSIFLAKEFGATVYATDLWIPATENYLRFKEMGLNDKIIPIHANALDLPYADEFFDMAVSVDACHYFAMGADYMDDCLAPLVKPGGKIAISVPGLIKDLDETPKELKPYISDEDFMTFRSCGWWNTFLKQSKRFSINAIWEPNGFDELWNDWLACENEYAIRDRDFIKDNDGKYLNFVSIVGKRI
jgi:cyclopropane fatty-acyl-phospholipid synthase-like methyltransferase